MQSLEHKIHFEYCQGNMKFSIMNKKNKAAISAAVIKSTANHQMLFFTFALKTSSCHF